MRTALTKLTSIRSHQNIITAYKYAGIPDIRMSIDACRSNVVRYLAMENLNAVIPDITLDSFEALEDLDRAMERYIAGLDIITEIFPNTRNQIDVVNFKMQRLVEMIWNKLDPFIGFLSYDDEDRFDFSSKIENFFVEIELGITQF